MLVSFIVVAFNAVDKLQQLLEDLTAQDYDKKSIEVLLIDSCSEDGTKAIMEGFKFQHDTEFNRICILNNPKKFLPCGWNIALKESRGDVILRVDAHARLPKNFIEMDVNLIKNGEKIVGGPRFSQTDENSLWQQTLLLAENSLFGSGIAKYRHSSGSSQRYVKTLAHAAYARKVFETVGGYDERLARTEDNEIHHRMRKVGYKFCFHPEISSYHFVRNQLSKMIKQKYKNGYWIGLTLAVSPHCFSFYHYVPLVFVMAIILSSIAAVYGILFPVFVLCGSYLIAAVLMSFIAVYKKKLSFSNFLLPFSFFILHTCYGIGTIIGMIKIPFWIANPENKFCITIEKVREAMNV